MDRATRSHTPSPTLLCQIRTNRAQRAAHAAASVVNQLAPMLATRCTHARGCRLWHIARASRAAQLLLSLAAAGLRARPLLPFAPQAPSCGIKAYMGIKALGLIWGLLCLLLAAGAAPGEKACQGVPGQRPGGAGCAPAARPAPSAARGSKQADKAPGGVAAASGHSTAARSPRLRGLHRVPWIRPAGPWHPAASGQPRPHHPPSSPHPAPRRPPLQRQLRLQGLRHRGHRVGQNRVCQDSRLV